MPAQTAVAALVVGGLLPGPLVTRGLVAPAAPPGGAGNPLPIRGLGSPYLLTRGLAGAHLPYDLAEAIAARLASWAVANLPGGCWAELAPEGAGYPLAVYSEPSEGDADRTASGLAIVLGGLDVTLYGPDKAALRRLADGAEALLELAPLAFAAGRHVVLWRSGRSSRVEPREGPDGADLWAEARHYEFRYARTMGG